MKFKNPTSERLTLPQLRLSIGAGETYTATSKAQAEALRKCHKLEEVAHSKSEEKRQRVQRGKSPEGEE